MILYVFLKTSRGNINVIIGVYISFTVASFAVAYEFDKSASLMSTLLCNQFQARKGGYVIFERSSERNWFLTPF